MDKYTTIAAVNTTAAQTQHRWMPMLIIGLLFFIFGFITWLNGALIPFLQIVCELSEAQSLLVAFSFYIAYVVLALPMAKILEITGYKRAMSLGLVMIAVGCLLFIPAAQSQTFALFLVAQFVVGGGLTILQTASNPYIVKVGPEHTAAVRISIMGLLNKGAGVFAPLLFTAVVLGDFAGISSQSIALLTSEARAEQINLLANGLIMPYFAMALVLLLLAAGLERAQLPTLDFNDEQVTSSKQSIVQFPQLILGMVALFCYVGVEVIAGDTIGLYGSQLGIANATSLTAYTMMFMVLGYLLGLVLIPKFISQQQALQGSAILGILLTVAIAVSDHTQTGLASLLWGWTGAPLLPNSLCLIALLGFANALVWPAVWPLALRDLGRFTAKGSALLIMGIAGGAILPMVFGALAERLDYQQAYLMMLPCYGFILYYAIWGCNKRQW